MENFALILAGGPGSRLWPLSRKGRPKQVQALFSGKSMLEITIERLLDLWPNLIIYVATGKAEERFVRNSIGTGKNVNLFVEPCVKSTGPAIALAVAKLQIIASDAILGIFPSDHHFTTPKDFTQSLLVASDVALHSDKIVLLGAKPTFPATNYGYIKIGDLLGEKTYSVCEFIEKPSIDIANDLVLQKKCLWNMGMFIGKLSSFEAAYRNHAPEIWERVISLKSKFNTEEEEEALKRDYCSLDTISIDFAVIEKAGNLAVVECDAGWSDLGDWAALSNVLPKDPLGNVVLGDVHLINTTNSFIHNSSNPIVVVGLSGIIVVQMDDVTLITSKDSAQDVSKIRNYLRDNNRNDLL